MRPWHVQIQAFFETLNHPTPYSSHMDHAVRKLGKPQSAHKNHVILIPQSSDLRLTEAVSSPFYRPSPALNSTTTQPKALVRVEQESADSLGA